MARGARRPTSRRPCATCRSGSRSTCPCASSSSSSSTPSNPPPQLRSLGVTTRPEEKRCHAHHPASRSRGRRARRQPPAVHDRAARAGLRPHARQQPAPHAAVVDPRRGRHPGALRRGAPRVRRHQGCEGRRHRPHPQPQGSRAAVHVRRAGHAAPRQARPGEVTAGDIQTTADVEILNPDLYIATVNANGPPRPRPHRRAGSRLPVGGAQQAHHHHRRDPGRRDLLAGAAGGVLGRAHPGRAGHQLRQAHARDRDRRFDLARATRWRRPATRCATWWRWSPT